MGSCRYTETGARGAQSNDRNGEKVYVYPADTSLGWRVVRYVSIAFGMLRVKRGEWRIEPERNGHLGGFQILENGLGDFEVESKRGSTTINAHEVQLVAGLFGQSRTVGLSEDERISRRARDGRALEPDDDIEKACGKYHQWPAPASRIDNGKGKPVYGDRAVRVYPRA